MARGAACLRHPSAIPRRSRNRSSLDLRVLFLLVMTKVSSFGCLKIEKPTEQLHQSQTLAADFAGSLSRFRRTSWGFGYRLLDSDHNHLYYKYFPIRNIMIYQCDRGIYLYLYLYLHTHMCIYIYISYNLILWHSKEGSSTWALRT